jgi:Tol biopolymer transport system component
MRKFSFFIVLVILIMIFSGCTNPTNKSVTIKSPFWVENEVRLVSGDAIVFEDSDGIHSPILSNDGKYIAYSNGEDKLFLYNLSKSSKKIIFELKGSEYSGYSVYAVGWSQKNDEIAVRTSYTGGFIGGNKLLLVNAKNGKSSVVTEKLNSAYWGKDGKLIFADSTEVKIIDEMGRIQKKLTTPKKSAFSHATNPTFSPDGKFVVYSCGQTYYLHDVEKDEYKELFETRSTTGPARISSDNKIIVDDKGDLYIYDINDNSYKVYFDKAKCSYPNW